MHRVAAPQYPHPRTTAAGRGRARGPGSRPECCNHRSGPAVHGYAMYTAIESFWSTARGARGEVYMLCICVELRSHGVDCHLNRDIYGIYL
jgi:hypothetical protein